MHDEAHRHQVANMLVKLAIFLFGLSALFGATATSAQTFDHSALQLLQTMQRQPNDLARYVYLLQVMPSLSIPNQQLAAQFVSFSQNELGIYSQAVLSFPLTVREPDNLVLPANDQWHGVPAADAIATLASSRHLVLINEAHHNAHTRQLTLELLPRLRALGFNYFAAEALLPGDTDLGKRGYPINNSGTEYLRDPLYGDIVRSALRLGFHVIAYDAGANGQAREDAQAETLYRAVFARDPTARLFVHAGYAHIDKAIGRLNTIRPMAMRLQQLTGLEPLSIDQTEFLESGWNKTDPYHRLIAAFPSTQPEILLNRADGKPWSARPTLYDVNVILPLSLSMSAFGDLYSYGGELGGSLTRLKTAERSPLVSTMANIMQRPPWLSLGGQRQPVPITATLCRSTVPCVVEARYANESDDAITADRYAFMADHTNSMLYLRPGNYRLRATDVHGKILSAQTLTIPTH